MSVYKKLQAARIELYNMGLKQTGSNKHSGVTYYELADFTVDAQRIFNDVGLCSLFNMDEHNATLSIIDTDTSDAALFSCPVFLASIPKESERSVKNLGATITYLRRYLWMVALEIPQKEVAELVKNHDKKDYTIAQVDANIEKWRGGVITPAAMIEKIKVAYDLPPEVEQYIIDNFVA